MRFHQAYYGATPNGHDLLACNSALRGRFLAILDRTDLQGIPPTGVTIESYVTAFRAELDFVIMRTSPDPSVTRGGMMFSHVFMTRVENIGGLYSLAPVINALRSARPPEFDVSDFESIGTIHQDQDHNTAEIIALANALVAKRDKPAVWVDTGDFLKTIDRVWMTSWPEIREKLTFSMALSPGDAHLNDYSVIYVQESQVSRWAGYKVVLKTDPNIHVSAAATALMGGSDSAGLREIAEQVCWPPRELGDIDDIAILRSQLERPISDPREEIRSLRLLCYLAPDPETATKLKQQIIVRAVQSFPAATLEDLLACRNLRLDCLSSAESFWTGLGERVKTLFVRVDPDKRKNCGDFLIKGEKESASSWKQALEEGLIGAFRSALQDSAPDIWFWIAMSPRLARFLLALVPETRAAEIALEATLPKPESNPVVGQILSVLATRDMPHLRAKCLSMYLSPDEAFDWELSTAVKTSALSQLCELYPPEIVVEQTARTANVALAKIAKAAVLSDASLLLDMDLNSQGWQLLIKELKGTKINVPKGASFDRVQRQMIELISSNVLPDGLLSSLESFGFFDLSTFAGSEEIWNALPGSMLSDFVEHSLEGVLLRLATGQLGVAQLVAPLQAQLTDRVRMMGAIRKMEPGTEGQQLQLFATLGALTEEDFHDWYSSLMTRKRFLDSTIVVQIGRLIVTRGWKFTAETTATDVLNLNRYDLNPLLPSIKPLLGLKLRFRLALSGNSVSVQDFALSDLWSQLETVLAERFPGGPRDHALWSRAKGSDEDLLTSASGRDQWKSALQLVRQNRQGSANLELLLYEATTHYPGDPSLKWLYGHRHQLVQGAKGW